MTSIKENVETICFFLVIGPFFPIIFVLSAIENEPTMNPTAKEYLVIGGLATVYTALIVSILQPGILEYAILLQSSLTITGKLIWAVRIRSKSINPEESQVIGPRQNPE